MKSSIADLSMKRNVFSLAILVALAGCSSAFPPKDQSALNSINDQLKQAAVARPAPAAVPATVSSSLLPPVTGVLPKTSKKQMEPRFDLVVKDTPIDQVLAGIVADTRYSLLIKPRTAVPGAGPVGQVDIDRVTVNLRDVTVFEALDTIRDVYGYDYTIEGRRIYVQPPELQTRLYQVNYIIGQRRGVSDLRVVGGASGSSSDSSSGSGTSGTSSSSSSSNESSSYSSVQATGLSSFSKSDLWAELQDVVRTTLGCQIPREGQSGGQRASTNSSSSSSEQSRADVSFPGDGGTLERQRGVDGCPSGRSMMVSPMSGTILIRGMPTEHRMIAQMLKSMQVTLDRQVIIEAKIMDVRLNADSQQGINWAILKNGRHSFSSGANANRIGAPNPDPGDGGEVLPGSLGALFGTGVVAATGGLAAAGSGLIAMQINDFAAMVNFLQTQGSVNTLSSPRISTINNQKAVIKVGTEEPYVTNITPGTAVTGTATTQTDPTLNYQPFFGGISLDVTPQIDERDNITLHVHALVNTITTVEKPSGTGLGIAQAPFARNEINETDTVVKSRDGQLVVIGGLMSESTDDLRSKTPGAGDAPLFGALFRQGQQASSKRELVILLKTTVVKDESAWTDDIGAASRRVAGFAGGLPQ